MNVSSGSSMNESDTIKRYCDENALCLNQYGSYYCKCNEGITTFQIYLLHDFASPVIARFWM